MASLRRRGKTYYAQYYVGSKQKRICLQTESLQIAREKLRKLESSIAQGNENPLPSRTPIADAVTCLTPHHKLPISLIPIGRSSCSLRSLAVSAARSYTSKADQQV